MHITFKHLEKQYFCSILKSCFDSVMVQDVHECLLRLSDIKHAKALFIDMADINDYPPQIGYLQGICGGGGVSLRSGGIETRLLAFLQQIQNPPGGPHRNSQPIALADLNGLLQLKVFRKELRYHGVLGLVFPHCGGYV